MSHRLPESWAPGADRGPGRGPASGRRSPRGPAALAAICLAIGATSTAVQAAEFERSFKYSGDRLTVTTLVGSVRVERAPGSEMLVTVHVRGEDASEKLIKFDSGEGRDAHLVVRFPVEEHRRYVYPKMGSGRTTISFRHHGVGDDNWLEELLDLASGDRIEVRGEPFGSAIELWTEIVVKVPDSRRATMQLGIGQVEAENVRADLELRVRSGPVSATGITGDVDVDTGSGAVEVRSVEGELAVDTGSGSVHVEQVSGGRTVSVDTGSGSVVATDVKGSELSVNTGSGGVDLANVDVKSLVVDTGSGGVDGERVGADDVRIDTGSGGVSLDLVRMSGGRYYVETGSGGIRFGMPEPVSAEFDIETGSGSIVADIDGVALDRRNKREAHFTVGKGEARVSLSTGSGSVRLSQGGAGSSRR